MLMTSVFFDCFEKSLAYTESLPSFIVVRRQMEELICGGFFAPPSNIGCAQTPSKIGLIALVFTFSKQFYPFSYLWAKIILHHVKSTTKSIC